MGSGDPTNRFSANSNASLILLYNCPTFMDFSTKIFDALEFAKIHIFWIGIHYTSLIGIWFAWTLSLLTLIFVKATREKEARRRKHSKLGKYCGYGTRQPSARRRRYWIGVGSHWFFCIWLCEICSLFMDVFVGSKMTTELSRCWHWAVPSTQPSYADTNSKWAWVNLGLPRLSKAYLAYPSLT